MPAKPTILNSQTLARTRLFHIEQVALRLITAPFVAHGDLQHG